MVEGRVNRIDSNGIDSKLCEERQVTRACIAVCQRINETGGFKERIVRVVGDCACKYGRSGSIKGPSAERGSTHPALGMRYP